MDKIILAIQVFVFCLFLYKTTFSQENPAGWGPWIDVSHCTARPCNCSNKDRVTKESKCNTGKLLQVRGCTSGVCQYQGGVGSVQKIVCYNLNKHCPGWSDWKAVKACKCDTNKTTGKQSVERTCTNPPPVEGLGLECVINDEEEGKKDSKLAYCNCTEEAEEVQTTEATTTSGIRYCACKNSSSESDDYDIGDVNHDRTSTMSTSTLSTTPDPYGLDIDYSSDKDDRKLCVCSNTTTGGTTGGNAAQASNQSSTFDDDY